MEGEGCRVCEAGGPGPPCLRATSSPLMAQRSAARAAADLDGIWYYVAKDSGSVEVANWLIDSITDRFFLLSGHPYLGRARDDDFGPGSRSFPVGEYVRGCVLAARDF